MVRHVPFLLGIPVVVTACDRMLSSEGFLFQKNQGTLNRQLAARMLQWRQNLLWHGSALGVEASEPLWVAEARAMYVQPAGIAGVAPAEADDSDDSCTGGLFKTPEK